MKKSKNKAKLKNWIKVLIAVVIIITIAAGFYYISKTYNLFMKKPPSNLIIPPNDQNQNSSNDQDDEELNFISFGEKAVGMEEEKNYLVLFLNSMELRPGGGYIGSFAKIKLKNGEILEKETFNTNVYDTQIPNKDEPPFLIKEKLLSIDWGLRDSNWYLDFYENAEFFLEIYNKQATNEEFDGVIAITSNLLPFILQETDGPITLANVEGEFTKENVLEKLEYEVEMNYHNRNVDKADRKKILNEFMDKLMNKIYEMSKLKKLGLANKLKDYLVTKDIQLYFKDPDLQNYARANNWTGEITSPKNSDYLSIVNVNLGAAKTDRCIQRNYDYFIDFNQTKPMANLILKYENTCREPDFMTNDYQNFIRVYTNEESELIKALGFKDLGINSIINDEKNAGIFNEKDKKIFGNLSIIKLNSEKEFTFRYYLNPNLTFDNYKLYFQKQPGANDINLKVTIKKDSNQKILYDDEVRKDLMINY